MYPLHHGINGGASAEVLQVILKACPEASKKKDQDGKCPLHCGIRCGASLQVIQDILAYPGAVEETDEGGRYPLHCIGSETPLQVIQVTLSAFPAATKTKDRKDKYPLHHGLKRVAFSEALKLMLKTYPEAAKEMDNHFKYPLHHGVLGSASMEVIQDVLEAYPVAVKKADEDGNCPLHCAQDMDVIQVILKASPEAAKEPNASAISPALYLTFNEAPLQNIMSVLRAYPDAARKKNYKHSGIDHLLSRSHGKLVSLEVALTIVEVVPEVAKDVDDWEWLFEHDEKPSLEKSINASRFVHTKMQKNIATKLRSYVKIRLGGKAEGKGCDALEHLLVMECGAGQDLSDIISHQNIAGRDLFMVCQVAVKVAECLRLLNEEVSVMHGDVKARNFVSSGVAAGYKAIDLDNVASIRGRERAGRKRTSSGYLPPEQADVEYYKRNETVATDPEAVEQAEAEVAQRNEDIDNWDGGRSLPKKERRERFKELAHALEDAETKLEELQKPVVQIDDKVACAQHDHYQPDLHLTVDNIPELMVQLNNVTCPYRFDFLDRNEFDKFKTEKEALGEDKNATEQLLARAEDFDEAFDRAKRIFGRCRDFVKSLDSKEEAVKTVATHGCQLYIRARTKVVYLQLLCGWTMQPIVTYKLDEVKYSDEIKKLAEFGANLCSVALSVAIVCNAAGSIPRMFGYPVPQLDPDKVEQVKGFLEEITEESPMEDLRRYGKSGLNADEFLGSLAT